MEEHVCVALSHIQVKLLDKLLAIAVLSFMAQTQIHYFEVSLQQLRKLFKVTLLYNFHFHSLLSAQNVEFLVFLISFLTLTPCGFDWLEMFCSAV